MANSQNGWPLVPAGSPQLQTLPGIPTGPRTLEGPVAQLLGYVAAQFQDRVEAITSTSSHRPGATIAGVGSYSNHASATAVDLNGGKHPRGRRGTFTAAQVSQIRQVLATTRVIDWGGDWAGEWVDEMHFEIRPGTTSQQAADAALALTSTAPEPTPPTPAPVVKDDGVLFRNNADGAVIFVEGGRQVAVLGVDYVAYQAAGIPVVGLSTAGFAIVTSSFA